MVWCGNGEGIVRNAHPALQGSFCGERKWCMEGKCVETTLREAPRTNGQWSAWSDVGPRSCSIGCVQCSIAGQIRVRRSSRHCSKPYPNNGGHDCKGDSARGIRCDEERCSGITVDEYATRECTRQRDKDTASLLHLNGKGYQYEEDLCKIWCVLPGDRIRTTSNFPDGTPCGGDRYCIKGRCRPLLCGGRAIVASEEDCPFRALRDDITAAKNSEFLLDKVLTRTQTTHTKRLNGIWSSWSRWGGCAAIHCSKLGIRVRQRSCASGVCEGASRQRSSCFVQCGHPRSASIPKDNQIPPSVSAQHYSNKQSLHVQHVGNASHNVGAQYSANVAYSKHSNTQSNTSLLHATNIRHGTGVLHIEAASRGGGLPQGAAAAHGAGTRRTEDVRNSRIILPQSTKSRHHTTDRSNGKNVANSRNVPHKESVRTVKVAVHNASVPQIANTLRSTSAHVATALKSHPWNIDKTSTRSQSAVRDSRAQQSPWSAWSVCSVSCGYGTQSRIRKCTQCETPTWEMRRCFNKECEAEWTQWGEWGLCDATCGYSKRYRRRRCVGNTCKGSAVGAMQCRVPQCADVSVKPVIGLSQHFRPYAPVWSAWSLWSACSATCGDGISRRVRVCSLNRRCVGISSDERKCKIRPCLSKPYENSSYRYMD
uniref:ADAMTS cysteine-rich domain-containing protein n=1 Tax=Parascaris univalens TaxID=6257 RepID=A0A915A638_PARUN